MRRILKFLRSYKLLILLGAALIAGLILHAAKRFNAEHWVLAAVSVIGALSLGWSMWQDIQAGRFNVNLLGLASIIAGVVLKQYWAALVIVIVLVGAKVLENYAKRLAKSELDALVKIAPKNITIIRKGKPLEIKLAELKTGDKFVIKAGEVVPADAIITEGNADFSESILTGEVNPVTKDVGAQILGGSTILDGSVTAQAGASADDSQYKQITRLMSGAAANQAPLVRLADRYSLPFTFLAFGIAVGAWVFSNHSIRFLEVITVATPCSLLAAPAITLIGGMSRATRYGIVAKTGSAFERIGVARAIIFNKTGTLTYGDLSVSGVTALGSRSQSEVLQMAASVEQASKHIIARAIVNAAAEKNVKYVKAKNVRQVTGRGAKASVKGREIIVGRLEFLVDSGVELPAKLNAEKIKDTVVYVSLNNELIGYVTLQDELRQEAPAVLRSLVKMGVKETGVMTGDSALATQKLVSKLELRNVYADMAPADKIHAIEKSELQPLAYVGDGIIDGPYLTAARVGVALGARGSTAAGESADIIILHQDLGYVAVVVNLAKRTVGIAKQGMLAGSVLSLILMGVFATGKFSALEGAVLQGIITAYIILNALRAHSLKADV